MNPRLDTLLPYPFERMDALKAGLQARSDCAHIALSLGEPKHPAPDFLVEAMTTAARVRSGVGAYPATRGPEPLRAAIAAWATRRFGLRAGTLTAARHVLPVNGTREALFSFAQAVLPASGDANVLMPNPFYQIYEGAALLAGARPVYVACHPESGFLPDFAALDAQTLRRTRLVYLCSPGNPTGAVAPIESLMQLIQLADTHDFVIAADECYSEIYPDESRPPAGLLEACARLGRDDYRRCVVFHSLSKRSSLPGLRSGFVAGDADILSRYYLYRTYQGCAMPAHVAEVSALAWADEVHVVANRDAYRRKFAAVLDVLSPVLDVQAPDASFYLWPRTPLDDVEFTRRLFVDENVTVLPGTFLSRQAAGTDPGHNRVRMALVAPLAECVEAATRVRRLVERL